MTQTFYVVRHPVAGYVVDIGRDRNKYTIRLSKEPDQARLYATLSYAHKAADKCTARFGAGFVVEEREVSMK